MSQPDAPIPALLRDAQTEAWNPLIRRGRPVSWWLTLAAALFPLAVLWVTHARVLAFPMTRLDELVCISSIKMHGAGYYFLHACDTGAYKVYRPVVLAILSLDHWLYGYAGWGFQLTGLLFASTMVLLFWRLASRVSGSVLAASAAAVFVATNPQNCQPFSMIAESHNNPPSATFFLASLLVYLRFQKTGRLWALGLAGVLAWLAIGSWEPGAAVLPALVILAWFGRKTRSVWYALGLCVVVLVVYTFMRSHALGELVQEYARDTRGYWIWNKEDVLMSELSPVTRLSLYVYTVAANALGTAVPALFTGAGRLRYELLVYAPSRISSQSDGSWLYQVSFLVTELVVLVIVLLTAGRRNWRAYTFGGLVVLFTSLASFLLYRERNHMIGILAYGTLIAVALADLWPRWVAKKRLRFGLLAGCLAIACGLFVAANNRWHRKVAADLKRIDVRTHFSAANPYDILPEVRDALYKRYPPPDPNQAP